MALATHPHGTPMPPPVLTDEEQAQYDQHCRESEMQYLQDYEPAQFRLVCLIQKKEEELTALRGLLEAVKASTQDSPLQLVHKIL